MPKITTKKIKTDTKTIFFNKPTKGGLNFKLGIYDMINHRETNKIEKLLEDGLNVNLVIVGHTLLMLCVKRQYKELFDIIMKFKPDIKLQLCGETALDLAKSIGWKEAISILTEEENKLANN